MAEEKTTGLSRIERITVLLKEYETLRNEMIARTVAEYQFGGVAVVLFVAWITSRQTTRPYNPLLVHSLLAAFVMTILLGFAVAYAVLIPLHEQLVRLEAEINRLAFERLLTWETDIRFPGIPRRSNFFAAVTGIKRTARL